MSNLANSSPERAFDPASVRHQSWRMRPWTMAGRSGRASFRVDQALGEEPGAERDARITYVIGFSGTGVLPTSTLGHCLASVVLGRNDSWAHHAHLLQRTGSYFPPEPIGYFGGRLIQRAIIRKEAAEEPRATSRSPCLRRDFHARRDPYRTAYPLLASQGVRERFPNLTSPNF